MVGRAVVVAREVRTWGVHAGGDAHAGGDVHAGGELEVEATLVGRARGLGVIGGSPAGMGATGAEVRGRGWCEVAGG